MRALAGGTFHEGVDYALALNTPLPALYDGVVVEVDESKKFGKFVTVRADNGRYYRWHAINEALVAVGERVKRGQIIARSGMTGYWSTGPHGHLQTTTGLNPNTHFLPLSAMTAETTAAASSKPFPSESEEDDMYDAQAQATLLTAIADSGRPLRIYTMGDGLVVVGNGGRREVVGERAYVDLLIAAGLAGPSTPRWTEAQVNWLCGILGRLNPDPAVTAQLDSVLALSPEQAREIAENISNTVTQIVLSPEMLEQITDAARAGGEEALRSLSFVTVVK
jgi:hypothetical protein